MNTYKATPELFAALALAQARDVEVVLGDHEERSDVT